MFRMRQPLNSVEAFTPPGLECRGCLDRRLAACCCSCFLNSFLKDTASSWPGCFWCFSMCDFRKSLAMHSGSTTNPPFWRISKTFQNDFHLMKLPVFASLICQIWHKSQYLPFRSSYGPVSAGVSVQMPHCTPRERQASGDTREPWLTMVMFDHVCWIKTLRIIEND